MLINDFKNNKPLLVLLAGAIFLAGYIAFNKHKENKKNKPVAAAPQAPAAEQAAPVAEEILVPPTPQQEAQIINFAAALDAAGLKSFMDAGKISPNFTFNTAGVENYPLFRSQTSEALLKYVKPNTPGYSPAFFAVAGENKEMLAYLAAKKADFNINTPEGQNLLTFAAQNANLDIVKTLLDNGALIDIENRNSNPFTIALKKDDSALLDALYESAKKSGQDITPVMPSFAKAVAAGNDKLALFIIKASGMDITAPLEKGATPLHLAAAAARLDVVKQLALDGAPIDIKDSNGRTPLFYTLGKQGAGDTIKFLVENGADVNVQDAKGATPLLLAVSRKDKALSTALLEAGANVNLASADGVTPLMLAAQNGDAQLVKDIISKGAEVNAQAQNGNTALMSAAARGRYAIVKTLLGAGASNKYKNAKGIKASDLAVQRGYISTYDLLERK